MHTKDSPLTFTLFLLAGACAPACADAEASDDPLPSRVSELSARVTGIRDRVERLEHRAAIRTVMDCYGYGHDLVFEHLNGPRAEALAILQDCFVEDVETDVFFFGAPEPVARLTSLAQLVDFIATNAINVGYASARNVPGNRRVELTGEGTARLRSSTSAPHFVVRPDGEDPVSTVDLVSARYENELALDEDGRWRTRRFKLFIDEYRRTEGTFPL